MALIDKLTTQGSVYTGLNGSTPVIEDKKESKLHDEYSINGRPNIPNRPTPSILDLDGVTPPTYRDSAPEGASF
jgi:hypothetical protein